MWRLLKHLLGGRPMRYQRHAFIDKVTGYYVDHYTDTLGRHWLAENKWSFFRVPTK